MNSTSSTSNTASSRSHPSAGTEGDAHAVTTGVVIVDHGSRREESNRMLLRIVDLYQRQTQYGIVEPAHMELAEPSIAAAFDRCVERGAERVIVMPYFLLPGKHWDQDIPSLTAEAAAKHPHVEYLVTAPLGMSELILKVIDDRIDQCLMCVEGERPECDLCRDTGRCQKWSGGASHGAP